MCQIIYMILQAGKTQPRQLCYWIARSRVIDGQIQWAAVVRAISRQLRCCFRIDEYLSYIDGVQMRETRHAVGAVGRARSDEVQTRTPA